MIDRDEAEQLLADGGHLFDGSGHDAGPVLRIYLDEYTGWPTFATIASDLPDRETLVALHEAERRAAGWGVGGVRVPYHQERIDRAPTVATDRDLSISEEDALFDYYGVPIDGVTPVVEHLGSVLTPHDADGHAPDVVEHDVDRPNR